MTTGRAVRLCRVSALGDGFTGLVLFGFDMAVHHF